MPRGPKPIPFEIIDNKKNRSTKRELQAREAAEPTGCTDALDPPEELSPNALKEWKRIVPLYRQLDAKILNDLDVMVMAAYCESVAIYKGAQREYQKMPLVGLSGGKIQESPYLRIMRLEGQNIAKYAEQLCLSPVGRARMGYLAAKKEVENDPTEAFLRKYGRD